MTSTVALIGHPVSHSISPRFQQAAFDAAGIDARYEAWDVLPEDIGVTLERLRSGSMLGANVTIPHKETVARLVERPDALVEWMGAANTIVRRDGVLHATNTDVIGITRALEDAGVELRGQSVLLLGAGGAARAVVVALRRAGAARLWIANRTADRAHAIATLAGDDVSTSVVPLDAADPALEAAARAATVIVNSTSLGMRHGPGAEETPLPEELFAPGQAAFDLVYVPERTPFLAAAERAGARTIGGLSMLIHQGAEAFRLWTGVEPPIDVMFAAARAALRDAEAGAASRDGR
ncbi:MAG: shikimate dehydrogenase [Chloroflexi bacterium]|nr:MAG: shikimate dehydrogenase [Chloroflexota bacterium]